MKKFTTSALAGLTMLCALNIIPVYGFAYLADIIVFNSIEFWTGESAEVWEDAE